jgi:hypothetical protein
MPSAEQLKHAAHALGYAIDIQAVSQPAGAGAASAAMQVRQITILLAVLEAIVVRCQLDQDWHDPVDVIDRESISYDAQATVGASDIDILACGLRRVQTLSATLARLDRSALSAAHTAYLTHAIPRLLTAVGLLMSAAALMSDGVHNGAADIESLPTDSTVTLLGEKAVSAIAEATDTLRTWIADRPVRSDQAARRASSPGKPVSS